MWIKICGNTTLEDAQAAADAGADAVGFIFAPSRRRVTITEAERIARSLSGVGRAGVFAGEPLVEVVRTVEACGLTTVQLHGDGPGEGQGELAAGLRERYGKAVQIVQVVHYTPEEGRLGSAVAAMAARGLCDAVLVDSRTEAMLGGTGIAYDWTQAAGELARFAPGIKLIAAGGLRPGNVAEAITALAPWGVDTASGVEESPGRKDHEKVRAFVRNAHRAFAAQVATQPAGSGV